MGSREEPFQARLRQGQGELRPPPPTTSVRDPARGRTFTFDQRRIHELFAEDWGKVYRRHADSPPDVNDFLDKYGSHIPNVQLENTFILEGRDLWQQAQRMRSSSHGFDGWTVQAIKALTWELWEDRAEVERLAFELKRFPNAYTHAPNPMLPKDTGDTPLKHRGITVFSVLQRVLTGAYWSKLQPWQNQWIHGSLFGARKGGDIVADAWELQAEIEAASLEGSPCVGALLDYENVFDLFSPDLARALFIKAGLPENLAHQLHSLYSDLHRYFKLAGTYGAVVHQTNGCPQGCSFSLFAANLYVTTLFTFLEAHHPSVAVGAFLDDRNVRTEDPDELERVLMKICEYDSTAGHKTNLLKSAVFGNQHALREKLAQIRVDGQALKCTLEEGMVGHTITTKRTDRVTSARMNLRAEELIRRAERIARAELPQRQKRLLIEQAAVPVSWCGCQWSLPRVELQVKAANTVTGALWGRRRKLRAKEVVLGLLHDPAKVDPASSLLYKRLLDARRVLKRSTERLLYATHVNNLLGELDEPPIAGPVHGLRAAARALGGRVEEREDDLAIVFWDDDPPIPITTYPNKVWKRLIKERLRKVIITTLSQRTVPKGAPRNQQNRTRKDMYGIGCRIDRHATMSLSEGRLVGLPKCLAQFELRDDPRRYSKEPSWRQRVAAILAGSLRGYDRLEAAGLCEGRHCHLCQHTDGDLEHLAWDCPIFAEARAPYLDAINAYVANVEKDDRVRAAWLKELLTKPCVRNCGLFPDDQVLHSAQNQPRCDPGGFCQRDQPHEEHDPAQRGEPRYRDDKILVFIDGSAFHPTDPRRTRAGWGVYVAQGHPLNASGHLPGMLQTSFRAELAAALHALTVVEQPMHMVSDCQAVVDGVKAMILGGRRPDDEDEDLWIAVEKRLSEIDVSSVDITWIKSHVSQQAAAAVHAAGGFHEQDFKDNDHADEMAKRGAMQHDTPVRHYRAADDREIMAQLVQRMLAVVWAEFFELHEGAWECEGEDGLDEVNADAESQSISAANPRGTAVATEQIDGHGGDDRMNEEGREEEVYIQSGWTTPQIAQGLKRARYDYCWQLDSSDYTTKIIMPEPDRPFDHSKGAMAHIRGRGRFSTTIEASPITIEGIRWWFNHLRWTPHWAERPDGRKPHHYTVTYSELVVDAEAATGLTLPGRDWHQKTVAFAALLRSMARVYGLEMNGNSVSWKNALDPRTDSPTLVPLGAPRVSGLARRPRWLSSHTPDVAAANVWRAVQRAVDDGTPRRDGIGRTFLRDCVIDKKGTHQVVLWRSRAEKQLQLSAAEAMNRFYEEMDKWQACPTGPPPRHPSQTAMGLAARLEDARKRPRAHSCPPGVDDSLSHPCGSPNLMADATNGSQLDRRPRNQRPREPLKCGDSPRPLQASAAGRSASAGQKRRSDARDTPMHHDHEAVPTPTLDLPRSSQPCLSRPLQIAPVAPSGCSGSSSSTGCSAIPIVVCSLREWRERESETCASRLRDADADNGIQRADDQGIHQPQAHGKLTGSTICG